MKYSKNQSLSLMKTWYTLYCHIPQTWTWAKVNIQCYFMWGIHTDKNESLNYWLLVGIPPLLLYPIMHSWHLGTWNSPISYLKISWDRSIKHHSIWIFSVEVKITNLNSEFPGMQHSKIPTLDFIRFNSVHISFSLVVMLYFSELCHIKANHWQILTCV